jgi:hypothetical protein
MQKNLSWKTYREETTWEARDNWKDNIKVNVKEIEWKVVDWVHLV